MINLFRLSAGNRLLVILESFMQTFLCIFSISIFLFVVVFLPLPFRCRKRGTRFYNFAPVFGSFIPTAKLSARLRRMPVGFAVALPPRLRHLPKSRIRVKCNRQAWTFRLLAQPLNPHDWELSVMF